MPERINNRFRLKKYLAGYALKQGDFTLNSGEETDIYFDKYKVFSHGDVLHQVMVQLSNLLISNDDADVTGLVAPAMGGAMFASALQMYLFSEYGMNVHLGIVRPELKDHGIQNMIEGFIESGSNLVIVEDVITSGKAVKNTIDALYELRSQNIWFHIHQIICLVDRGGEGVRGLREEGYDVSSVFTLEELERTPDW